MKILSEDAMKASNQELNIKVELDTVSVGDKFWHTVFHETWKVTKISVQFTDEYDGTPSCQIELFSEKSKRHQLFKFPSAHAVYGFTYLKRIVSA